MDILEICLNFRAALTTPPRTTHTHRAQTRGHVSLSHAAPASVSLARRRARARRGCEGKMRGYAFIEFEREADMRAAYKRGDGRKIGRAARAR